LHRVLDAGVRPKAVVVEIFPPSLVANLPAEGEFRDAAAKLSAADVRHLAPYCDDPAALWRAWGRARAAPWHTQRTVLMSHWLPDWQPRPRRVDFQWESLTADGF